MKKFAVVLAGCGVFDGAEIHEATLTMLAIKKQDADYVVFAPDIPQYHVINHVTGEEMPEKRNVLVESARIARGNIKALSDFNADDFDALIFPGGFGAAKNLCDFAFKGTDCTINAEVESSVRAIANQGKPIGALCISPVIMAKIFGAVDLTIGQDPGTSEAIENMGANHVMAGHGDVVVDKEKKLFTTPCYMLDATIVQIADSTDNIVKAMLES
ncbi:MAG: isoprenoid biosynthesis glyoxalase ElbB, partial [Bacteroidales bacterium]|nr:isoprenoid biosynthesis glyoxalase ElbB [Bacteroidales bacterium]